MSMPPAPPPPPVEPGAAPHAHAPHPPPMKPAPSKYDLSSQGLQYLYLYSFVFENPQWILNVLFVVICSFIPVVGYIVLMGYQLAVIEQLYLRPSEVYPDFEFGKFVDYLKRGVWPFLIFLIVYVVCTPIVMVLFYGPMLVIAFVASNNQEIVPALMAIAIPLDILLLSGGALLMFQFLMPMFLRAGLMQDLPAALNWHFIRDFIRRVWLEMLLGNLFLLVTYLVLLPIGVMFFFVGAYFVMAIWLMAQAHLLFQVYRLYLQRGGEKIPLVVAVPPVRPEMMGGGPTM